MKGLRERLDDPDQRLVLTNYTPGQDLDITETVKEALDLLDSLVSTYESDYYGEANYEGLANEARDFLKRIGIHS